MGTCICCGKDATHGYDYYVGEKIKFTRETFYKNVMRQTAYLCKKCCNKFTNSLLGIGICTPLILLFKFTESRGNEDAASVGAILVLLLIICIIRLIQKIIYRMIDKGLNLEKGTNRVIAELKRKETSEYIVYLTPEEFKNLQST